MRKGFIQNEDLALEIIYDWAYTVERIIGAGLRKKKVKISEPTQRNIRIQIIESLNGIVELQMYYRDALRFVDMGAGNGYHKGRKINQSKTPEQTTKQKGRRKKAILNKPLYTQLARLQGQLIINIQESLIAQAHEYND